MALFENFPYTNFHNLNMDWVITTIKDFLEKRDSLEQLINDGKIDIQNEAARLEALLQAWYDTHSEDIANQLVTALNDLNAQLNTDIAAFIHQANVKTAESIASIPSDYSTVAQLVENLRKYNSVNITPPKTGSETSWGIIFDWGSDGSCYIHGTNSGGLATSNIFYDTTALPDGFEIGKTYYGSFDAPSNLRFQILGFDNSGTLFVINPGIPGNFSFEIPSNTVGMAIRIAVTRDTTVNATIHPLIKTGLSNTELSYNQVDLEPEVRQLQADVASLQTNEMSINLSSASNINNINMWEQGSISPVTGENVVSTERIRTISYLPTNVVSLSLETTRRGFFICGYQNDTFIGVYNNDGRWTIDEGSGYSVFDFSKIYYKYPNVRLRVYLYTRDTTPIALNEAESFVMQSMYSQLVNPVTIRIMQNNIGQFNYGHDGGWSGNDLSEKIMNYRKLLYQYKPDIITLQEYRNYINSDNTASADIEIFSDVKPFKSYEQNGYVVYSNFACDGFVHTYLHTDGDYPARMVYGTINVNNMPVAIGTAALNAMGSSPDGAMKIRALTKMINLLADYNTAIIGLDANPGSETEASIIKGFMKSNGYQVANWDYIGYLDTFNPQSSVYKAIDNVFIKGKVKFQNVEVVPTSEYGKLLSDHLPIIADVLIYK